MALGGSHRPMVQVKNVVANMAKHENPNNHIDLETFKKNEYFLTDFTGKMLLVSKRFYW